MLAQRNANRREARRRIYIDFSQAPVHDGMAVYIAWMGRGQSAIPNWMPYTICTPELHELHPPHPPPPQPPPPQLLPPPQLPPPQLEPLQELCTRGGERVVRKVSHSLPLSMATPHKPTPITKLSPDQSI